MSGLLSPLVLYKDASVTPLFMSRVISSISVGMGHLALAWGVMSMGYGARELSIVLACNAFPALLILWGGIVGDRFRRHHVLVGAELTGCLAWLALGASFTMERAPLPLLCSLAGLGGVATAIFLPTVRGVIADLLEGDKRPAGNALINQTESVGQLIGFVSSGAVVTLVGPDWAAGARGILCGISAVLLSRLVTQRPTRADASVLRDLREGWREFIGRPWVWIMTLHYTAITTALVCYMKIAGPLYTQDGHGSAWAWGVISAAQPLGALAGALIGARWRPARLLLVTATLPASVSLPMLLMGSGTSWQLIALAAVVPGVLQAVYYVFWTTALQNRIPRAVLVRVNSWNIITSYILMPLIVLLSGPLVTAFGPQPIVLAAAGSAITATVVTLIVLLFASVARLPTEDPEAQHEPTPSALQTDRAATG
ncbi:MFS transporter [Actinomadura macra]|uniref:MFS transporter n=1 Tax=Actinomadura macra TaxID=46164 RepID=UPI000836C349|nr:MFS transporter [Actinomadura macra]